MSRMIQAVLNHAALLEKPPVLVDVGATGKLRQEWAAVAPYAICIAFDGDARDFSVVENSGSAYRKLYTINRIVAPAVSDAADFYLTRSPHCSSTLRPDADALQPWDFCGLFRVAEKMLLPAVTLDRVLDDCGIGYIDWYKSDSQGTDLRIFDALSRHVSDQVVVAEFEPGIIDAYHGEDKLHQLMRYMDNRPFWVTDMHIKGARRIDQDDLQALSRFQKKWLKLALRPAPGWCEISYLNTFEQPLDLRRYLLGWVFATIKKEHGFALHLAKEGAAIHGDCLFRALEHSSRDALQTGYGAVLLHAFRRAIKRFGGL